MFKNKSLLVTPVNTDGYGEESNKADSYSGPSRVSDVDWMIRENWANVAKAIVIVKGCFTLCRAFEHIVVTKIK